MSKPKFRTVEELLAAVEKGWRPPPLPPAEELRRVRLLIEGCLEKMLEACPEEEKAIVAAMRRADSLEELKPWIDRISAKVERKWPGLVRACARMIDAEKKLAEKVS